MHVYICRGKVCSDGAGAGFQDSIDIARRKRFAVTLDGRPMHWCVEADDVNGYVVVFRVDDHGALVVDPHGGIERLKFTGKVKINEVV